MDKIKLQLSNRHPLVPESNKSRVASLLPKITFSYISNLRLSERKLAKKLRSIFEHKHIKKILGSNIALAIVATSFLPGSASAAGTLNIPQATPEIIIKAPEAPLTTKIDGVQLPVPYLKINQKFSFFHPGVDLGGSIGNPIKPVKEGIVEKVIYSRVDYGNHIIINHGNGVISLYAHLSKIFVKEGDSVTTDQIIGLMGSTGHSTGPHLHLEIHDNGRPINPLSVIQ